MTIVQVHLDDATYERLCRKAAAAGQTPDEYLASHARGEAADPPAGTPPAHSVIGMWADDPAAVDAMLEAAMEWRRERNEAMFDRIAGIGNVDGDEG